MKKLVLFSLSLLVTLAASGVASAGEAKRDPVAAGHDFALKVCAACHVVGPDQKSPPILKPPAPSFASIAKSSTTSQESLRKLLSSPHGNLGKKGKMPNPMLADYQIDEVIAYLLDLQKAAR